MEVVFSVWNKFIAIINIVATPFFSTLAYLTPIIIILVACINMGYAKFPIISPEKLEKIWLLRLIIHPKIKKAVEEEDDGIINKTVWIFTIIIAVALVVEAVVIAFLNMVF